MTNFEWRITNKKELSDEDWMSLLHLEPGRQWPRLPASLMSSYAAAGSFETLGGCCMTRIKLKKILVGCIVAVLLFGAAFAIWLSFPQPTASVPISFLGVTNDRANGALATFSITNQTRWTISYHVYPAQVESNGVWSPLPALRGAWDDFLPSHQVSTFTVPVPLHGEAWRVPVFWGCVPTGLAHFRGLVKSNLKLNWYLIRRGRSLKFNRGAEFDIYASYSPEETR